MKINKIILRIAHFFGKRKGEAHIDDILINLSTQYPEKDFEQYGPTYMRERDSDWVIEDIKSQVYQKFDEDKKLKANCARVQQVYVDVLQSSCVRLLYKEGVLYYPCPSDRESFERQEKLNAVLNK